MKGFYKEGNKSEHILAKAIKATHNHPLALAETIYLLDHERVKT